MAEYINKSDVSGLVRIGWSGDAIVTAIINDGISSVPAIPVPEGTTNGDVIKAMFDIPDSEIDEGLSTTYIYTNKRVLKGGSQDLLRKRITFSRDWWNAPYKGECNLSEKSTGSESEDV